MERRYLMVPEVLYIHVDLIATYGGPQGVRDMGALESALVRPIEAVVIAAKPGICPC